MSQPTPQDQLSQVIQQLAQLAVTRLEVTEKLVKIDQQTGLLRDSVAELQAAIAQQQPKPE